MPKKNEGLIKIEATRPDLSDYVYHFTNGKMAEVAFHSIVGDRKIKDKSNVGYICFTEAPLLALVGMFEHFKFYQDFSNGPKYAPYGIAIHKDKLFNAGGRHVIYGPESEIKLIDPLIHWRYEKYSVDRNFGWLREWRIKGDHYLINPDDNFLIVDKKDEELELAYTGEIFEEVAEADGYELKEFYKEHCKEWRSIAMEILKDFKSKKEMHDYIDTQLLGHATYISVGDQDPRESIGEEIRRETYFDMLRDGEINDD